MPIIIQVAKEGPGPVKIQDVLLEMRTYRMGLIQTEFQLKFSYEAIAEGARQHGHVNLNILSGRSEQGHPDKAVPIINCGYVSARQK